ncbi:class I SAM-dependent methyltransferase [Bacillus sp. B1-b2]|uniref:class I SAM-dependent methyltransferase n=1 Tax=Bacillus sp. B1-b2 TaxID=2653201 RepID=UPI0012628D06|nr:class I SAM-dependent methyltransferase [Bacillus sp. B1-b2]KAB7673009.1 hypothetical protein F9279_00865 [Bacillus sp. B1-b2]
MIVTTSNRTNDFMQNLAKEIANNLQATYMVRNKRSIEAIKSKFKSDVLVIGKEKFEFFSYESNAPFFFHPNSAMFRIKRLLNNESDPFVEATNLRSGSSFLDCTLGLGSDSIVASFVVGSKGQVIGIEANPIIATLVATGLKEWNTGEESIDSAMRRITVKNNHSLEELKSMSDRSFDSVYIDPMFEESIDSVGLQPLKQLAVYDEWTKEMIFHAKRVTKNRVVLKDHYKSKRFEEFGFKQLKRKSAKFHYGIWEKEI